LGETCFICEKHKGMIKTTGTTIYEDPYIYVGHIDRGEKPTYLGHIMIDLKRHAPSLGDMTIKEASAFGIVMAKVSKALKQSEKAEHVYALVSGNSVPHLHMHVIPRYPNTPQEFWGPMDVYDWPEAPFGYIEEIVKVCDRLKIEIEEAIQHGA
jgi:histidine triad (HIT) family protein